MEFSDKILKYFTENNIQPATIAKATGIDKSTFSKWKSKPTSKIDFETVYKIVSYLNISIDYLLTGEKTNSSSELSEDEQSLLVVFNKLPERQKIMVLERANTLLDIYNKQNIKSKATSKIITKTINIAEVAAGAGVSTPFTIDNAFSPKEFPSTVVPKGVDCGVPINGDSMEPDYPNGSIVWVKITQNINYGDVVIATLNGEPYCKIYQPDGLYSINEKYPPILVNEYDNFSMFGKVIGYYEK